VCGRRATRCDGSTEQMRCVIRKAPHAAAEHHAAGPPMGGHRRRGGACGGACAGPPVRHPPLGNAHVRLTRTALPTRGRQRRHGANRGRRRPPLCRPSGSFSVYFSTRSVFLPPTLRPGWIDNNMCLVCRRTPHNIISYRRSSYYIITILQPRYMLLNYSVRCTQLYRKLLLYEPIENLNRTIMYGLRKNITL